MFSVFSVNVVPVSGGRVQECDSFREEAVPCTANSVLVTFLKVLDK